MPNNLQISVGAASDKGIKEENQDYYGMVIPEDNLLEMKGAIFAIADGVSASLAAQDASKACVSGFISDYLSTPESWSVKRSAGQVLNALNRWLYGQGQCYREVSRGWITTFTGLILKSTTAYVFHVGDSRIYRYRDGELEQLTSDHRVRTGRKDHYLSRAMGIDLLLDVDYRSFSLEVGDLFLLSTDGIHDTLSEAELRQQLQQLDANQNLEQFSKALAKLSLEKGSQDNITCQLIRIEGLPGRDADDVFSHLQELPFPPELKAGMRLDGYRVIREIHSSSTSQLYLAEDEESGQKVVLKTPSVNYEDDPAYLERFLLEEWIGNRLRSDNILRLPERKRSRQFLYYALDYIEGQSLEQWIQEHPVPSLSEVQRITGQLNKGVLAFHRMDTLHQDLKPDNVLIDQDGTVKIVDFGSAKIAGMEEITTPVIREMLLGTRNYTAPEYYLGAPTGHYSDLFSVGVITYRMLTGNFPYGENQLSPKITQHSLGTLKYTPVRNSRPDIPIWVDKAIEKAVHLDPSRRYDDVAEFDYDLNRPNRAFIKQEFRPLLERNPVAFWRTVALISLAINLLMLLI